MNKPADELFVAIVDDDSDFRDSLRWLLESVNLKVRCYSDGESFLDDLQLDLGCILLDVRMPGLSGIQVLERLKERDKKVSVIIVTGHGDVPMAVYALTNERAFDFIEKPFNDQHMIDSVQEAINQTYSRRRKSAYLDQLRERFRVLNSKEQQILCHAAEGLTSRQISEHMDISPKTAEIYRVRAMKKMGAGSLLHWVRMAEALKLLPSLNTLAEAPSKKPDK